MIVVDASAVLELILNGPPAQALRARIFRRGETVHAPHVLDVEVLQVMRRYLRDRVMTGARADEALANHFALPIERYSHEILAGRIWALRANLTAYDAAYVALAEVLNAPLLTADGRLARSSAARHVAELIDR